MLVITCNAKKKMFLNIFIKSINSISFKLNNIKLKWEYKRTLSEALLLLIDYIRKSFVKMRSIT